MKFSLLLALTSLFILGCRIHRPSPGSNCMILKEYSIDPKFSAQEAKMIRSAMRSWWTSTGGQACMVEGGGIPIKRISDAKAIKSIDDGAAKFNIKPAGWWNGWSISLIIPRIYGDRDLFSISIHELGHSVDIKHYDGDHSSFMHPNGPNPSEGGVTIWDAAEFCRIHKCRNSLP